MQPSANPLVQRMRDWRCSLQFGRQWSRTADHRRWALALIMRISLFLVLFLALVCQGKETDELISLRYMRRGPLFSQEHRLDGAIFWVTNHTSKTLTITVSAVEVKVGTKWITQSNIVQCLMFQPVYPTWAAPRSRRAVAPHEAGYGYARAQVPTNFPAGTTWRVRANVQPMLEGLADEAARVKAAPGDLLDPLHIGNTNYLSKPSTLSNRTYWGKGTKILSAEVLQE
jgi:hypothetical protein